MHTTDIHAHARRLLEAYGANAMVVAAKNARTAADSDNEPDAEAWRKIEAVIAEMRGAPQS
jgi:hypothetical protein